MRCKCAACLSRLLRRAPRARQRLLTTDTGCTPWAPSGVNPRQALNIQRVCVHYTHTNSFILRRLVSPLRVRVET